MDELFGLPEYVPVFPLPGIVLFPRAILPLHIFEPRYREMMADALAGDRLIAIALLKSGFEPLYYTRRAPIHDTLGVGQILGSEQVEDGNYNLLLRGVARARVVDERKDRPYRLARIEPVESYCSRAESEVADLIRQIFGAIRGNRALPADLREHWLRLGKNEDLALGDLTDVVAAGVPIEAELRQTLLGEPDAAERARALLLHLRTIRAIAQQRFRIPEVDGHNFN